MDSVEIALGASREDLRKLHKFAQGYLDEQKQRKEEKAQELERMRDEVKSFGNSFQNLWDKMKEGQRISVQTEGDKHIVIERHDDRIRMAETTNPDKDLGGYSPGFGDISRWQVIVMDWSKEEKQVGIAYHWDKGQLNNLENSNVPYWGSATQIELNTIERATPDQIVKSFENLDKFMPIPDSLPLSQG